MKQEKRIIAFAVALALAVFLLPAAASAESITAQVVLSYTYGSNYTSWNDSSRPGYEANVSITSPDLELDDYETYGYCVDPWQGVGDKSYSVELVYLSELSDVYYQVAWLLDSFAGESGVASTDDGDSYLSDSPNVEAAALQAVVWTLVTGDVWAYAPKYSYDIRNQSKYYYDQLNNHTITAADREYLSEHYMVGTNTTRQDIIIRIDTSGGDTPAVPEPGTMVLFGSAAGLMAWYKRRRKVSADK